MLSSPRREGERGWKMTCIFINFARVNTLCMQNHGFVSVSWECPRAKVLLRIVAGTHPFFRPTPPPETARVGWRCTRVRRGCTYPSEWAQGASTVLIVHRYSPWCFIKATISFLELRIEFLNGAGAGNFGGGEIPEEYFRKIINCNSYV